MVFTKNYGEISFVFKEKEDFKGCTLLNGWHGIGECGYISVSHIVEKIEAKRIGFIITENIPQFITIKNERITFPFEIYRKDNLVIVLPIFEPIKSEHLKFTKTLVKWCIDTGFKQAILVGGLDNRLKDDNQLKAIYTQAFIKLEKSISIPTLDEGLYVTGPLAYVMLFSELHDFPAMALLPYAERSRPDPIAASIAIKEIEKMVGITVDISALIEQAEKIEKEIQSLLKANKPQAEKDDSDKGMFV
ncbi:MAG: PAC2 family protein [Candidatus Heimdallarchaeum aukensis]|uniref:PAC2 family protein n=1 Tax=Candidatus Heimdallarchaeum aukensis TaxID=2876573 RepID=A0A9Y1FKG4_9ARCH|nr:MAG: PAC2 family protein [Candidatus Heimdallarchaeum aukensis]